MSGIYRAPSATTEDYPGLVVCDSRVSGSITIGKSRLPLWAIITTAITEGWPSVKSGWPGYRYTADDLASFLCNLLDMRGEFARLLTILADVERRDSARRSLPNAVSWQRHAPSKRRVIAQLRLCLAALESE